jgi:hypothetical protein
VPIQAGPIVQVAVDSLPFRLKAISGARGADAAAIAVLALVAAIAAFTFRDYGLGWDDYTQSQYGDLLMSLYASGFADKRALSFVCSRRAGSSAQASDSSVSS